MNWDGTPRQWEHAEISGSGARSLAGTSLVSTRVGANCKCLCVTLRFSANLLICRTTSYLPVFKARRVVPYQVAGPNLHGPEELHPLSISSLPPSNELFPSDSIPFHHTTPSSGLQFPLGPRTLRFLHIDPSFWTSNPSLSLPRRLRNTTCTNSR